MKLRINKIILWPLCLFLFIGLALVGNSDVLCIGDDGRFEFETICLPCCDEAVEMFESEALADHHDGHEGCINCSDLTPDGPMWSKRFKKNSLIQSVKLLATPAVHNATILASTDKSKSQVDEFLLTFGQSPPSASIAITVLRC